jgi:tetratricopeptide (TPR) repeat protein
MSWIAAGVLAAQTMSTGPGTQRLRMVQGKVTDREGRPIAGAVVVLENKGRGFTKEALSDNNGNWSIRRIMSLKNEEFDIFISAENFLTGAGKIAFMGDVIQHFCELNHDPRLAVKELLAQAEILYQAGDHAGAQKKYEEVMTYDLASATAELGCGLCELGMGNMTAAREHMEKAISLARTAPDPKVETTALEYLGDLMVRQLDLDKALEYFLEALELEYERTDTFSVKIADIYALQKKPALALFYYQKALRLNPGLGKDLESKIRNLPGVDELLRAAESGSALQGAASPPQDAQPAASNPEYEKKLQELLQLAASHCQKLENAAFRFFCLEDVVEVSWPGRTFTKRNTYRYDFQIVGGKRRISEKRKLLLENGQKAEDTNASQRTIFQSQLKFYAPIELLGAGNQKFYHYRILKEELVAGEPFLLLRIEARTSYDGKSLLEGSALVSPKDGSVIRIEVAQGSIAGVEERRQRAREEGFDDILIRDIHWFEKIEKGLRFPSRSEMREIYLKDQMQTLHYTVSYSYSTYTFFDVRINEIDFQ